MIDELPKNRIPLYLVGEWIATEGGTRDLGPPTVTIENKEVPDYRFSSEGSPVHATAWDEALEKLKAAILAGELPVEGQRDGDKSKPFELISPQEFGDEFENPFREPSLEMIIGDIRHLDFDEHRCGVIQAYRNVFWSNICARSRDDVLKLWPAPAIAAKRGRKAVYDWSAIEAKVDELMDFHGDFSSADPEWNAQARLETAIIEWCETQFGIAPAIATLRPKLAETLKKWLENRMVGK